MSDPDPNTPSTTQAPPPGAPPRPGPKRGRWLTLALILSVGVNLAVLGLVVGATLGGMRDGIGGAPDAVAGATGLGPYARALEEPQRREIGRAIRSEVRARGGFRQVRSDMRERFDQAIVLLREEPLDAERLSALMHAQSQRAEEFRTLSQTVLIGVIVDMSPAERAAYAQRLEVALSRGPRRDRSNGPRKEAERDR